MNNKPYPYYDVPWFDDMKIMLEYCSEHYGAQTAFWYIQGGNEICHSYNDFRNDVAAYGTYLSTVCCDESHIAILGENSYEWIVAYFAIVNTGRVAVPIEKELESPEIHKIIKKADVSIIIHSSSYYDEAHQCGVTTINMSEMAYQIDAGKKMINGENRFYADYNLDNEKLCTIVFTSGTTGAPKGVMLSHKSLCSSAFGAASNIYVSGNSILFLPLYHLFGLVAAVLSEMYYGYSIFIAKNTRRVLKDIQVACPQHFFAVPVMLEHIVNIITKLNNDCDTNSISSFGDELNLIVSGAAPLSSNTIVESILPN